MKEPMSDSQKLAVDICDTVIRGLDSMLDKPNKDTHYHDGVSFKPRAKPKAETTLTISPVKDSPTRCCYCHEDFNESETKDTSATAHCPHFNRDAHTECMIDFGSDCHECQAKARKINGVKVKRFPVTGWEGHCVVCQEITWRQSNFAGENVFVCNGPCYAGELLRHIEKDDGERDQPEIEIKWSEAIVLFFGFLTATVIITAIMTHNRWAH